MAGALGKPVLLMLARHHAYIWHVGRDDSPWYPTVRLFRQERFAEWEPLARRVAHALQDWVNTPPAAG